MRRALIGMGATDEQADEFVESMDDLLTKDYLAGELYTLQNQMLLAGIGLTGINIGAMALLTQL